MHLTDRARRMVETWISLVRNMACVLKSILPEHYAVMQPLMSFPLAFLVGSSSGTAVKLEHFTGLDGLIGVLQLAGAAFNLIKGAKVL